MCIRDRPYSYGGKWEHYAFANATAKSLITENPVIRVTPSFDCLLYTSLVLQDVDVWYDSTKIHTTPHSNMTELYFEDNDIELSLIHI